MNYNILVVLCASYEQSDDGLNVYSAVWRSPLYTSISVGLKQQVNKDKGLFLMANL